MNEDIVLIDKPAGWTSFDVVAKLRGKVRAEYAAQGIKPTKRQLRVGHAGTLDPFATGLLIIFYGDACKKAGEFLKLDKVYEATVYLGATSTTGDPEGEISQRSEAMTPSENAVEKALASFVGEISQTPPQHSAIKIGGVRAYKLAREGESVDIPSRQVTIYSIELLDYSYPHLKIRIHASSGTYIRTLAEDIGRVLGTDAYCIQLRRVSIDAYSVENAKSLLSPDNM